MDVNRKELSDIKDALKKNPRGMTVMQIAKAIGMNRHSVAKYLDMLVVSGYADMRAFGPSKVYYPLQRLPISSMLSLSTDLILILDREMGIINVNDPFLEYTGIKRIDILNKSIEYFSFPLEFKPSIIPSIRKALIGKESVVDAIFQKGKKEFYFTVKFIPTVFEDGANGVTIIFEDVTERKRIENAIRESEQKFRNMLDQSSDGIIISDERGYIIEYNRGCELITGSNSEEMLGKPIWESRLMSGQGGHETKSQYQKHIRSFLKTGRSPVLNGIREFEFKCSNGEVKTIQVNAFSMQTDKGYMICGIARDITDLKKAEMNLVYSEERFRTLAETFTSGIAIFQDGKLIYENHAARSISGYSFEDMINAGIESVVHPEFIGQIKAIWDKQRSLKEVLGSSPNVQVETKIIKKSGEERWIDLIIWSSSFNGKPAVIAVFNDITERKMAELVLRNARDELERRVKERTIELERSNEALRESKEKYLSLLESLNDVAWEIDRNGRFSYLSRKIKDIIGYEPSEMIGKTILEFMPPEIAKSMSEEYTNIFEHPGNYYLQELVLLHKDGREIIIEANGVQWFDKNGVFQGYRGVTRGITERKKTEEALRQSEERYRSLTENINDIAWEMDTMGRFTYVSPKIHDILGFWPEHYIGKVISEFMPQEDRKVFLAGFGRIYAKPRPYALELLRMFHEDGRVLSMEVNGTPFYDDRGEFCGFRGVTRDITKRMRMGEMLELMKYSIDHSEDAAFWIRPDGSFDNVNDAASRMLGYTREEFMSMKVSDIDIGYMDEPWQEHWETIKRNKYFKIKTTYKAKNGKTIPVEINENHLQFNEQEYDFAFVHIDKSPFIKAPQVVEEPVE